MTLMIYKCDTLIYLEMGMKNQFEQFDSLECIVGFSIRLANTLQSVDFSLCVGGGKLLCSLKWSYGHFVLTAQKEKSAMVKYKLQTTTLCC